MFTRQHFEKFAALIKKMHDRKDQLTLTAELLKMFKADNPRFEKERFLKAAGIEDSPALSRELADGKIPSVTNEVSLTTDRKDCNICKKSIDTKWKPGHLENPNCCQGHSQKEIDAFKKKHSNESVNTSTKLGTIMKELSFHGGNPTKADVQVLADDFEDAMEDATEQLDNALSGAIDSAREADFPDIASKITRLADVCRRNLHSSKVSVLDLYKQKQSKLPG